jgi:hypothetical protein
MPYKVERSGRLWLIKRSDTGKVVGKSTTARKAHISIWMRTKGEKK